MLVPRREEGKLIRVKLVLKKKDVIVREDGRGVQCLAPPQAPLVLYSVSWGLTSAKEFKELRMESVTDDEFTRMMTDEVYSVAEQRKLLLLRETKLANLLYIWKTQDFGKLDGLFRIILSAPSQPLRNSIE